MYQFTAKKFEIPSLKGISEKNIEEHLKLYAGYVKNTNSIIAQIDRLMADAEKNAYLVGELQRRFGFEYNGMRNHEAYFGALEGGARALASGSKLKNAITAEWDSFDGWLNRFKTLALTRGIGWAVLWYDRREEHLLMSWVDEQHLGQLNDCAVVLGLDMWEHSYVYDYQPSGKKQYIEDFLTNLNWSVIEKNFANAANISP